MKSYINQWICLFVCVIFLMTTPGSVFAEISEAENCENISSEELFLPILEIVDCETMKDIEILDQDTTEDGKTIINAHVPLIQEGSLASGWSDTEIETNSQLQSTKEQVKADILKALNNLESTVSLSQYRIPAEEYKDVINWYRELVNSQPQLFYVNGGLKIMTYDGIVLELQAMYSYPVDDIIMMRVAYENSIQEIVSHVKDEMSVTEKVLAVHDVFCQSVEYDYENYYKGTVPIL